MNAILERQIDHSFVMLTVISLMTLTVTFPNLAGVHAATTGIHQVSDPQANQDTPPVNPRQDGQQGKIKVESSGHQIVDPRAARPNIKVLKSHTYNLSRRSSTGWVKMNGVQVPVDTGVEHDGVIVYVTLLHDVVAVNAKTNETLWSISWGKTMPMWQTVTVVDLGSGDVPRIAVELFAAKPRKGKLTYRYVDLKTGDELPAPVQNKESSQPEPNPSADPGGLPIIQILDSDDGITRQAVIAATPEGRSPLEMLKHFSSILDRHGNPQRAGSVTNMETIVSAFPRYLLGNAMDADAVLFNLPEGSGMRAAFEGDQVKITKNDDHLEVVITNGNLTLYDSVGVTRATASPDGGAEQLVVRCEMDNDEVVMTMRTRRLKPDKDYPNPPVQVRMNVDTDAAADEEQPPHGSIRYEIFPEDKQENKPVRMKMKWRYDLKRLADEVKAQTGKSWDEILYGDDGDDQQQSSPNGWDGLSTGDTVRAGQAWVELGQ